MICLDSHLGYGALKPKSQNNINHELTVEKLPNSKKAQDQRTYHEPIA